MCGARGPQAPKVFRRNQRLDVSRTWVKQVRFLNGATSRGGSPAPAPTCPRRREPLALPQGGDCTCRGPRVRPQPLRRGALLPGVSSAQRRARAPPRAPAPGAALSTPFVARVRACGSGLHPLPCGLSPQTARTLGCGDPASAPPPPRGADSPPVTPHTPRCRLARASPASSRILADAPGADGFQTTACTPVLQPPHSRAGPGTLLDAPPPQHPQCVLPPAFPDAPFSPVALGSPAARLRGRAAPRPTEPWPRSVTAAPRARSPHAPLPPAAPAS